MKATNFVSQIKKNKKNFFTKIVLSFLTMLPFVSQAQMAEPVQWSFTAEKVNDKEYNINLSANIADGWFVYSQHLEADGPVPTTIKFDQHPSLQLKGSTTEEGQKKEGFDQVFGMNIVKYTKTAHFSQKIIVKGNVESLKGQLRYMTCNGEMCMPPKDVNFNVNLTK